MRALTSAALARGLPAALLAAAAALLAMTSVASVAGQPNTATNVPFWHFTVAGVDDSSNNFTQVVWAAYTTSAATNGSSGAITYSAHVCGDAACASGSATLAGTPGCFYHDCRPPGLLTLTIQAYTVPSSVFWVEVLSETQLVTQSPPAKAILTTGCTFAWPSPRGGTAPVCGTWQQPCAAVQDAVNAAPAGPSVSLYIGPGVYSGSPAISFGSSDVQLRGLAPAQSTVIRCEEQLPGGFELNSYQTSATMLRGFTVTACKGTSGSAVRVMGGAPQLRDLIFINNSASQAGGAMYVQPGSGSVPVVIDGCSFVGNNATHLGGGLSIQQGTIASGMVLITDSVFYGNYGADFGGAIYMESVGVELRDVLLEFNACAPVRGLGGGLASVNAFIAASNVTARNNAGGFTGGGMHLQNTQHLQPGVPLSGITVTNNTCAFAGGFAVFGGSNLTFTNCSILNNESQFHAGGVMSIYATTYILNSTISGNRAGLGGGGAKALAGTLVLDGVKVNGNSGSDGGALEVAEQAGSVFGIKTQLNVTNSVLEFNRASGQGGAFNAVSGDGTFFANVTFHQNSGVQGCGYCSTAISMVDSLWQSNMALYGGALYVDEGCSLTVHNTTFSSNYAQANGGAIIVGDGVNATFDLCTFLGNGVPPCDEVEATLVRVATRNGTCCGASALLPTPAATDDTCLHVL